MAEENLDGQTNTDSAGEESQADVTTETEEQQTTEQTDTEQQDGEQSGDADSDGEGGDSEAGEVPDSYEFEVPEGMELDQGLADAVTPVFKELGLNQEQASKLTSAYAQVKQQEAQQAQADFDKQLDQWASEIKNDKEIGGEAFDANAAIARKAVDEFGSPELKELLDTTGFGNNPHIFKFMLSVGKLLNEDQPGSGERAREDVPTEQALYPDMYNKK